MWMGHHKEKLPSVNEFDGTMKGFAPLFLIKQPNTAVPAAKAQSMQAPWAYGH